MNFTPPGVAEAIDPACGTGAFMADLSDQLRPEVGLRSWENVAAADLLLPREKIEPPACDYMNGNNLFGPERFPWEDGEMFPSDGEPLDLPPWA